MLERSITAVATCDPAGETAAATRERLKPNFAPGAVRRMTLLGMMLGSTLKEMQPGSPDTVVYSSLFGETNALEAYLSTFPSPSPTLFQTSIHPSGVQQSLINRRLPVREFFPMSGSGAIVAQSAAAALMSEAPRAIWCGGDERATWMTEHNVASERTFAFAICLEPAGAPDALGTIRLANGGFSGHLALDQWFDIVHQRRPWRGPVAEGWELEVEWR